MSKDKNYYSFIITPGTTSKARRISIHKNVIYTVGAIFCAAVLLMAYGLVRLTDHEALNWEYLSVKAENESLKKENDVYQNSYAKLKGQISYIEDMSNELARQASMESPADVDQQVGTGGPETVAALDKAADQLEREVRQIGDRLRADMLRLASIPAGFPVNGYVTDGFGLRRNPFSQRGARSSRRSRYRGRFRHPRKHDRRRPRHLGRPSRGLRQPRSRLSQHRDHDALRPPVENNSRDGPAPQARRPDRTRGQHGPLDRPARSLRDTRKRSARRPRPLRPAAAPLEITVAPSSGLTLLDSIVQQEFLPEAASPCLLDTRFRQGIRCLVLIGAHFLSVDGRRIYLETLQNGFVRGRQLRSNPAHIRHSIRLCRNHDYDVQAGGP